MLISSGGCIISKQSYYLSLKKQKNLIKYILNSNVAFITENVSGSVLNTHDKNLCIVSSFSEVHQVLSWHAIS